MLSRSHAPSHRTLALAALLVTGLTACAPTEQSGTASSAPTLPAFTTTSPTSSSAKPSAASADHGKLLLTAADLSDAEDTFIEQSREPIPDGTPGASAFFVNEADTRAISNTLLVYPDAAAAGAALQQAIDTTKVAGDTQTAGVGQDGVVIKGTRPDEDKSVTLLMFTEGPAVVRMEFQSATGDVTTDDFVTSVGKMQQIALRYGLPGSQQ